MAIGIIAGFAKQRMGGPGASPATDVCVVTASTKSPKIINRTQAAKVDLLAALPNLFNRQVSDVSSRIPCPGKRWASLHRAVSFQANDRMASTAASPVRQAIAEGTQLGFVGAKIADVIADNDLHAALVCGIGKISQKRQELQKLVGLEEKMVIVNSIPHRHRQLKLPLLRSRRADLFHEPWQHGDGFRANLGIHTPVEICRPRPLQRFDRHGVNTGDTPYSVMVGRKAVDGNADSVQPRADGVLKFLLCEMQGACLNGAIDPVFGNSINQ